MKCEHQISEGTYHTKGLRQKDLFLLYKAKFLAKIAKNGHYALIGARRGETLSRHVIDFDQWEHSKM